jgi:hypothetical protein
VENGLSIANFVFMKVVLSRYVVDIIDGATNENTGFNFKKDHCYRLLKNISHVYNLNRDRSDDGYVMLCAKYLQSITHEYRSYMEWMERVGIVQIDHSYQNSHPDVTRNYCKNYKIVTPADDFMPNDRDRLVQIEFKANTAIEIFIKSVKRTHGLSFMVKWLRQLTIDDQLAHDLNWQQLREDLVTPRIGYKQGEFHYEPYRINPQRAYNSRKDNVVAIGMKQFYMSRDETSGRLHSNVTGLSSRIFPALRIKGEPLVGYDIANSQPFLCSALINLLFDNEQKKGNFTHFFQTNPISTPQTPFLSNSSFLSYLKSYSIKPNLLIVMLEDFLSEPDLKGVLAFQNFCFTGQLYQEIARNVFGFEYEFENKRRVKDLFFTLFFTKPGNNRNGIPKFKQKYPGIHTIISKIKELSADSNFFPILLQCMESYYIIERVCKRMNKEYPKAPLFTKHDSVYTTHEYLERLKLVMEDEALKLFGVIPRLNRV